MTPNSTLKYDADRVAVLASEILRHKKLYYSGKPEIADVDYDKLEDELRVLAPAHPALKVVGAGSEESTNKKVVHDRPMLSLNKTYSESDLQAWAAGKEVVGTLKVDGTSMSLVYLNGLFSLAKTRGNGREGEDVTAKLKWVSDAIPKPGAEGNFEIRGELYCTESNFLHLAAEMNQLGLETPTSPRNIVAGILGRKVHGHLARYFNFFAFDVLGVDDFATEMQKMAWLEQHGYRMPHPRLLKSPHDIEQYLKHVRTLMEEDEVGCDGAVFSYNALALHEELGATSHHPRYKLSFKWQGETARSEIARIEWATSRLGIVTPVAVIKPVELSGATITNITLHNAAHVRTYNLKPGDVIELVRSGEVIPKFLSVVTSADGQVELPTKCPSCNSPLIADDVRLKCLATDVCPAQQIGVILNWIRCAEIDDLSEKRLQAMIDIDLVHAIPDLYRLEMTDFLKLPATKEKMATKLLSHIQATKSLPLARFLNGLGIEGAGLTTWEKILETYSSLERVQAITAEDLVKLEGFAEKSAQQIVSGLKRSQALIRELLAVGIVPIEPQVRTRGNMPLSGMHFVITGALSRPRKEIEDEIKRAGGKTMSAVSRATTAVVTNDKDTTSSKMVKAKELGIPIWDEETLMQRAGEK